MVNINKILSTIIAKTAEVNSTKCPDVNTALATFLDKHSAKENPELCAVSALEFTKNCGPEWVPVYKKILAHFNPKTTASWTNPFSAKWYTDTMVEYAQDSTLNRYTAHLITRSGKIPLDAVLLSAATVANKDIVVLCMDKSHRIETACGIADAFIACNRANVSLKENVVCGGVVPKREDTGKLDTNDKKIYKAYAKDVQTAVDTSKIYLACIKRMILMGASWHCSGTDGTCPSAVLGDAPTCKLFCATIPSKRIAETVAPSKTAPSKTAPSKTRAASRK